MAIDPVRADQIRSNTDLVIAQLGQISGIAFGLNEASVVWLEGYIARWRKSHPGESASEALIATLGSFLGDAIRAATAGEWFADPDGNLGIEFASGDACFPINKIAKQFAYGTEGGDGIAAFYRVAVEMVAKGKLTGSTTYTIGHKF